MNQPAPMFTHTLPVSTRPAHILGKELLGESGRTIAITPCCRTIVLRSAIAERSDAPPGYELSEGRLMIGDGDLLTKLFAVRDPFRREEPPVVECVIPHGITLQVTIREGTYDPGGPNPDRMSLALQASLVAAVRTHVWSNFDCNPRVHQCFKQEKRLAS